MATALAAQAPARLPPGRPGPRRRRFGRPRAAAPREDDRARASTDENISARDAETSSDAPAAGARHWSAKLRSGTAKETTRDDLRYMSAAVVAAGARDAERGVTAPRLLSVKRDRDNVVFVDDERLVTPFLADALGVDEREAARAFRRLCELYPAARERAAAMGVSKLARLCSDLPGLSRRLMALESLFPECDVATMAAASPWLLELSAEDVKQSLEALQSLFPEAGKRGKPGVHRMVQAVPQLLDASFAARAAAALAASLGVSRADAATRIHRNPRLALEVESASVRSRYSVAFDQGHVKANKVVRWEEGEEREAYYRATEARAVE